MIHPTDVQDTLARAFQSWEPPAGPSPAGLTPRERVLGLKFAAGQTVLDTVTGKEVEIIGGAREVVTVPGAGSA